MPLVENKFVHATRRTFGDNHVLDFDVFRAFLGNPDGALKDYRGIVKGSRVVSTVALNADQTIDTLFFGGLHSYA